MTRAAPALRLEVLGRSLARIRDRVVRPSAERVFAGLLLLGLERGRRWSRHDLGEMLWPDVDESLRLSRLRWFLAKVRRLGLPIEAEAEEIVLSPESVAIDIDDVAVEAGQGGDLLPGYHPEFSRSFALWLEGQRDVLSSTAVHRLESVLASARQRRDWPAVLAAAASIRSLDSENEDAVLATAEATGRLGRRAEGVAILGRYLSERSDHGVQAQVRARALLRRLESVADAESLGEPTFVGRNEQLRRIETLLSDARAGRGGALILTGPAGIGKTRLLDEARAIASVNGIRTVRVRCTREGVHRPLSGIADLVPQLLELRGAAGSNPEHLARLRRFTVASDDSPVRSNDERATPAFVRAQLVEAVIDVLAAVTSEGAILLQIDDVQWVDQSLGWFWRDLLQWSESSGAAWLFGFRTPRRERPTIDAPIAPVGALELTFAREMIDDLARKAPRGPSEETVDAIVARGAGSPLFITELMRQWSAAEPVENLPSSLSGVVDRGVGSLSPHALRTLQVTAVLGAYATLDRVEEVCALPRGTFVESLLELDAAGMMATDRTGDIQGHVLWGEAAMARLSPGLASVIHRHAAERFDTELSGRADALLLWEAARHWSAAGRQERACEATIRGAEHLLDQGFPEDAAVAFGRAADMTADGAKKLEISHRRVDALYLAAQWAKMDSEIDHYNRLAGELDPLYTGHNDLEILRLSTRIRRYDRTREVMHAALACARNPANDAGHRIRAARVAANAADAAAPEFLAEIQAIVREFPETASPENWYRLRALSICERRIGDVRTAEDLTRQCLADANRSRRLGDAAKSLAVLGQILVVAGKFDEAQTAYEESVLIAEKSGNIPDVTHGLDHLIGFNIERNELALARALLVRGQEMSSAHASMGMPFSYRGHEATLAILEGDYHAALSLAMPVEESTVWAPPRIRARVLAVHVAARLGLHQLDGIDELAEGMVPGFEWPDDWLDWPASVYAEYLEQRRGLEAATRFAARFVNEIRRELYPAPARLRELAALASSLVG